MITMYPGMVNSPKALLSAAIAADATSFVVDDGAKLPAAPNLAVLGVGDDAETILYTVKSGDVISGITRAVQGTAKVWPENTIVARNFTEKDYAAILANLLLLFPADETAGNALFWGSEGVETKSPADACVLLGVTPVLLSDKSVYISPTGSDETGDGTSGNPWATPEKAHSVIPKNLGGRTATINIAAGTYAQGISAANYYGGALVYAFAGDTTLPSISLDSMMCFVVFTQPSDMTLTLNLSTSNNSASLYLSACFMARMNPRYVVINRGYATAGRGVMVNNNSVFVHANSLTQGTMTVNNAKDAIFSVNGSTVNLVSVAGAGNGLGLQAVGGDIRLDSSTMAASTLITKSKGGHIWGSSGSDFTG